MDIEFLAMCVIIIQISNLFEFYKIKEEIKKLKEKVEEWGRYETNRVFIRNCKRK